MAPKPADRNRINVVARSHYGIRPQAFQHWNDLSAMLQAPPAAGGEATNEIHVYGLILPHEEVTFMRDCFGDETAMSGKMFRDALEAIEGDVTLRINSDGGDVFEAAVMVTAIREHQEAGHKVTAKIDGMAASAATLLTSASDHVMIGEMGFLMIHQASGGAYGNADDLERGAKVLRDINASAARMYAKRAGMSEDEVNAMMDAETYLSAVDAVEKGLADEVMAAPEPGPKNENDDDDARMARDREKVMARRSERLAAVLAAIQMEV